MKWILLVILITSIGCKGQKLGNIDTKLSKKVLKKQYKNPNKVFAISSYWGRKKLLSKTSLLCLNKFDTLFMIERITEPGLQTWGYIWNSKRDRVVEYSDLSGNFRDTTYNYSEWTDKIKKVVEKFDTTSALSNNYLILGGYRGFITQVIRKKEIKTFFFYDYLH